VTIWYAWILYCISSLGLCQVEWSGAHLTQQACRAGALETMQFVTSDLTDPRVPHYMVCVKRTLAHG
jgi:hypothetical protein